ncbi:RTA1-like protein [Auricularia subglabra TFB-10046 SS5]|uniref:RTA1-like protein n=1 Tax=Auricularia subglabra (strain TFB-10046 / SS5) TaxID=717982 RepID=J0D0K0_AURST|nr:RTA1-like protein [Auricularia subglabra TFB-10046 SS5]
MSPIQHGLSLLALAILVTGQAASQPYIPADPYADPKHDPLNLLRYISNDALVGVANALTMIVALSQLILAYKYRTWWLLILPISIIIFSEGLAVRFILSHNPRSLAAFIAQSTLVVLSPCAFIAADYMLLGRLAKHLGQERHMLILPSRITKIFVLSDVTTFLVQGTGSGMSVVRNPTARDLGSHVFFAGLLLQLISFTLFTAMFALWTYRVRTKDPHIWLQDRNKKWYRDWRSLAGALAISCVGIIIRCIYRVAEGTQGYFGPLATTEWIFYTFDVLPLFIAVSVFVPFWPGRFLPAPKPLEQAEMDILRRASPTGQTAV